MSNRCLYFPKPASYLSDELDNTTSLNNLALSLGADVPGTDNDGDLGETALAEELGVAVGEEVDDGGRVGLGAADVLVAGLKGDERPELLDVDGRSPLVVAEKVEVSHADLSEVTGMVLIEVGAVVVLTTGHTTTTRVLSVLADATLTGGHMAAVLSCLGKPGRHGGCWLVTMSGIRRR